MNRDSLALDFAAALAAACLILGTAATLLEPNRIYVSALGYSMNDQVNHIGIARTLADTGHLGSTLVYPAALGRAATKTYVYLPGYHVLAAAFYRILGYSDFVALLPSACAYVASGLLLILIGRQMSNPATGRVAAFLFLAFPANVLYALSAMTDMCLVAATLLAFYSFVRLPLRLHVLAAPLLLLAPVLVRETGALLVVPMVLLILLGEPSALAVRLRRSAALLALSMLVVICVLHSDFASGRPSLQRQAMFTDDWSAFTSDAVAYRAVKADWSQVPAIFAARAPQTVLFLLHGQELAASAMRVMLAGIPLGIIAFARRPEPLGLIVAAYVAITAGVHVFHFLFGATGMRMLLPTFPFTALLAAGMLVSGFGWLRRRGSARAPAVLAALGVATWLAVGWWEIRRTLAWYPAAAALDDADAQFIASLGHDDRRLLAAPYDIALSYVHRRYPVKWSFVPENPPTLALLKGYYDVGTVVLPVPHPLAGVLPLAGFTLDGERVRRGAAYTIWRARPGQAR